MSDTRFQPGQSGNPNGRPRKSRRPNVSAFEIILDKSLVTTRDGKQREATVEEALQQQTLIDAFAGKRMAIRKILKMIEKREVALAKKFGATSVKPISREIHHSADNANEAMRILGIADENPAMEGGRLMLATWAAQAALSRPGRQQFDKKTVDNVKMFTFDAEKLRLPRGRIE